MYKKTHLLALVLCGVTSYSAQSLTLNEAVEYTLNTNPEVQAAFNQKKAIAYEIDGARSGYKPDISVSAAVGKERRTSPATGNVEIDLDRQELAVQARQMLFDGFATRSEVDRQSARYQSAVHSSQAVSNNTALRATEVYLNVLKTAKLLDLARDSLWEHTNIYDQMVLRQKQGVGSRADLDQIISRLALSNSNMVVAQNNFADAKSNYQRVIGLFPNVEAMLAPDQPPEFTATKDDAVKFALEEHPTLKSASFDVASANAQYEASKAPYWPRLTLEADKRWDENVGLAGEDEDFIVSLRLTYDLYAGGANKARKKQTAILINESKDIRNNARRQVVESMQLSWNAFDALTTQLTYLEQHAKASERTKDAYAKQFNIGKRTLLDLLNTENEVVDARRSLVNAQFDRLFSLYRIRNANGTILESLNLSL